MSKEKVSNTEDIDIVGIPTMALMPSKNYHFKVLADKYKITVNKSGKYLDLDEEFFSEEDGSYTVVSEDGSVFNIAALTKILFGEKKYPSLKGNQLFCPISLVVNEDTVDIFGQVVEMIEVIEKSVLEDNE